MTVHDDVAHVQGDASTQLTELTHEERGLQTRELLEQAREATTHELRQPLLDRVVEINARVAVAVAHRYAGRGVEVEDLEQAALEGLTKAVARFDPEHRPDLLTYAVPTIRGEVQRYFRDHGWMVRPPRRVQELQQHVRRATDDLAAGLGREPTDAEVCREVGIDAGELAESRAALGAFRPGSTNRRLGESDDLELGDALPDPHDERAASEARVVLAPVVRRLSERDRRILFLRFYEDQTQREIGEEMGVAQTQVSRSLSRIYDHLREEIGEDGIGEDGIGEDGTVQSATVLE